MVLSFDPGVIATPESCVWSVLVGADSRRAFIASVFVSIRYIDLCM